jgi:hypothetical protein
LCCSYWERHIETVAAFAVSGMSGATGGAGPFERAQPAAKTTAATRKTYLGVTARA